MRTASEVLKASGVVEGDRMTGGGHRFIVKRLSSLNLPYLQDENDVMISPYILEFIVIPLLKKEEPMVDVYQYLWDKNSPRMTNGWYTDATAASKAVLDHFEVQRVDWTRLSVPVSQVKEGYYYTNSQEKP